MKRLLSAASMVFALSAIGLGQLSAVPQPDRKSPVDARLAVLAEAGQTQLALAGGAVFHGRRTRSPARA